jgi:hypothetical protein
MAVSSPARDRSVRVERWPTIVKPHRPWRVEPNLTDVAEADYQQLVSLGRTVDCVAAKIGAQR